MRTPAGPSALLQSREGGAQRRDVAQIARLEPRPRAGAGQFVGERAPTLGVDIDEADQRALRGESPRHVLTDSGCAAGDEHHGAVETGVVRE